MRQLIDYSSSYTQRTPDTKLQTQNPNCFALPTFSPTFARMFEKLKQKWKVNGWQLLLIIVTFGLGGSLCGFLGKQILNIFNIEQPAIRIPIYIILVTLLWPICVLAISIPFGQFPFFRSYIKKIFNRVRGKRSN